MKDKKLTDSEIIKALECCSEAELKEDCKKLKCPFFDNEIYNCMNVDDENAMYRYALDLINRLQTEKQDLEIELKAMRGAANSYKAEIERLKKFALIRAFDRFEKEIKAEAYKEFAERLKEKYGYYDWENKTIVYPEDEINNLLKELVGEDNASKN